MKESPFEYFLSDCAIELLPLLLPRLPPAGGSNAVSFRDDKEGLSFLDGGSPPPLNPPPSTRHLGKTSRGEECADADVQHQRELKFPEQSTPHARLLSSVRSSW